MRFSKKLSLFLAFIFVISAAGSGFLAHAANFKMVKHLSVEKDDSLIQSIISWGGTVDINGTLNGTIMILGGHLKVNGIVEEDVFCIASDIHIGEQAQVKGDLFVIGGTLDRHPNSIVKGEYFNFKVDIKKIESTLIPILFDSRSLAFIKAIKILLWFIITLLVFAIVPRQINKAEEMFEHHIARIGVTGIVSIFIFIFLFFAFIVLSFIIIGIPFLLLLVLFYFMIYIFGRTVIFYFIGIKLSGLLRLKKITPALFIVMGVAVYSILKFIPFVGPLMLILLNIFEVGISVAFLFRKKLRLEA